MTISAQVSVYPLRQEHLSPAVEAVRAELEAHGLRAEVGAMSTQVVGDAEACLPLFGMPSVGSQLTARWL